MVLTYQDDLPDRGHGPGEVWTWEGPVDQLDAVLATLDRDPRDRPHWRHVGTVTRHTPGFSTTAVVEAHYRTHVVHLKEARHA